MISSGVPSVSFSPKLRTTIRPAMLITMDMSCSTRIIVCPQDGSVPRGNGPCLPSPRGSSRQRAHQGQAAPVQVRGLAQFDPFHHPIGKRTYRFVAEGLYFQKVNDLFQYSPMADLLPADRRQEETCRTQPVTAMDMTGQKEVGQNGHPREKLDILECPPDADSDQTHARGDG